MIGCDLELCIHNKENECLLPNIFISSYGTCFQRMIPQFPDEIVQKCKAEMLKEIEYDWQNL